jgi:hypothetical protein
VRSVPNAYSADLDRRALDAGDLALGLLQQFRLEVLALGVAQVHALEHAAPVLRLGAAGAGLDLDEAVVRVERIAEHALELELGDLPAEPAGVGLDRLQRRVVVVGARHLEQLARVGQPASSRRRRPTTSSSSFFSRPSSCARLGRSTRRDPPARADFRQPALLRLDVKDTSAGRRAGCSGRRRWLPGH